MCYSKVKNREKQSERRPKPVLESHSTLQFVNRATDVHLGTPHVKVRVTSLCKARVTSVPRKKEIVFQ